MILFMQRESSYNTFETVVHEIPIQHRPTTAVFPENGVQQHDFMRRELHYSDTWRSQTRETQDLEHHQIRHFAGTRLVMGSPSALLRHSCSETPCMRSFDCFLFLDNIFSFR